MTGPVLAIFRELSAIPRRSKDEARAAAWARDRARANGWTAEFDAAGNVLITIPATAGCEAAPMAVLQAHLDMVCIAEGSSRHDFSRDPIRIVVDGEWLTADGTTLGADNGIGVALAFALLESGTVRHGPTAILLTVDEETGMTGALGLARGALAGRYLINLDTEEDGFIIGCAGGRDVTLRLDVARAADLRPRFAATLAGLRGGHSGLEIANHRANAAVQMARWVRRQPGVRLASFESGTARNAIPGAATVEFHADATPEALRRDARQFLVTLQASHPDEGDAMFDITPIAPGAAPLDAEGTARALDLLLALPFGVRTLTPGLGGLVETSNNLAPVRLHDGHLECVCMVRSSVDSETEALADGIAAVGRLAGAMVTASGGYPGWAPDFHSHLVALFRDAYERQNARAPHIGAVHAGLECGIILERMPGAEAISLGPCITGAHTPAERCHIPSIEPVARLVSAVLGRIAGERA